MKKTAVYLILSLYLLGAAQAYALNPLLLKANEKSAEEAPAAEVPDLPANMSAADIDALMARLNDEQVRRLLIEELRAEAAATPSGASEQVGGLRGTIRGLENATQLYISRAYRLVVSLPNMPGDLKGTLDRLTDYEGVGRLMEMIFIALCLLATGWVAEKIFFRFTSGLRQRIETMPGMEGILRFWGALINALPECLGLLIFAVTPLLVSSMVVDRQDRNMRLLFLAFLMVAVIIRVCALVLRLLFSPKAANLRLLPLSCAVAQYLHRRLLLMVNVVTVSWVLGILLLHLEVTWPVQVWFFIVLGSLIIVMFAGMVWSNRHIVKNYYLDRRHIACEKRAWLREQFASMWHILAIAYLFLVWLLAHWRVVTADEIKFDGTYILSLLIVPIYLALDRMAQWCVISVFARTSDAPGKGETPAIEQSTEDATESPDTEEVRGAPAAEGTSYLVIASRAVRVVVFIAVALWFLDIWGFHITFGEAAVGAVVDVLITLLLAHIAWEFINSAINRKLAEGGYSEEDENKDDEDEWGGSAAQDRSHTLLPMLRKFIGVVMVVMVTLIVLSSIGVEIGPLLAGAGVIGLAIGFGAQTLVKDIIAGVFFLIDDAFRVGDYIQAAGTKGSVEHISLRSLRLRHPRGMVNTIPFGDIGIVTNMSRDYIITKLDFRVRYDTDVEKVRKIIKKKVYKPIMKNPELAPKLLDKIKSQGVRELDDSAMIMRVKYKTAPGEQFVIRKEVYRLMQEAFSEEGIEFAHRNVTVYMPPELPEAGSDAATQGKPENKDEQSKKMKEAAAAAALAAAAAEEETAKPKK